MRARIIVVLAFSVLLIAGLFMSHNMNTYAQTHAEFRQALLSLQLMDFMTGGGGPFGPEQNYWAWQYTTELHNAPTWKRLVVGEWLMYQPLGYWVQPPKEWPYPPKPK